MQVFYVGKNKLKINGPLSSLCIDFTIYVRTIFAFIGRLDALQSMDIKPINTVKPLDELVSCTKFSRQELQQMYRGFKNVKETDDDNFKHDNAIENISRPC